MIAIIGGGASGMLAGAFAAHEGNHEVILFEKNEKLGKKIYITGKGRCNVTNACPNNEFFENIITNPKFLMSAIHRFTPYDMMDLLEKNGLNLTVERGNRVFPSSNKSSDVIRTLQNLVENNGVKIMFNTEVLDIIKIDKNFKIITNNGNFIAEKVILATGGLSYQSTGSTGDGYKFAKKFGHTVISPLPALCSVTVKENVKQLEGLSLKNVRATASLDGNIIASESGEMLFTDKGLSGPIILTLSSKITRLTKDNLKIVIDLKPALSDEQLDNRLLRDFKENINRDFKNSLNGLLPKSLIPFIIEKSNIPPEQKVNVITQEQRKNLVFLLKNLMFCVQSLDNINNAIITSGGICVDEINPKTMESKLIENLYFAGEVIDVDAQTGGFNLQIAFSTGYVAGLACKN